MKYIHRTGADHISSSEPYYLDGMRGSDNVVHDMPEWIPEGGDEESEPKVYTITLKEGWFNGWTRVESSGDNGMDEMYDQDIDQPGYNDYDSRRTFDRPFTFTYSGYINYAGLIEFVCNRSDSDVPMYLYVRPNGELIIYCTGDRGSSIYWWQKFSQIDTGSFKAIYTVDLFYVEGLDEVLDDVIEIINPNIIIAQEVITLPPEGYNGLYPVAESVQTKVYVENISNVTAVVYGFECYNNKQREDSEVPENEIVLEPGESSSFFTEFITQNDTNLQVTNTIMFTASAEDQSGNILSVLPGYSVVNVVANEK